MVRLLSHQHVTYILPMDTTHTIPPRLLSHIHQATGDVTTARACLDTTVGTVKDAVLGDLEMKEGTAVHLDLEKGVFIVKPPTEAPAPAPAPTQDGESKVNDASTAD